jgi:hypothetical protein
MDELANKMLIDLKLGLSKMIADLVEAVPGQLFRDIERFYRKFGLEPTADPGHRLPDDVVKFRIKFLFEELQEYAEAVGFQFAYFDSTDTGSIDVVGNGKKFDAEAAFDGLIDLAVICLGTAYLHRFPFNAGWSRVYDANMKKVRAKSAADSKRGHAWDIVKPPGWAPPTLVDLLDEKCSACQGAGTSSDLSTEADDCRACAGTGRRNRASGSSVDTTGETCPSCKGKGKIKYLFGPTELYPDAKLFFAMCHECGGTGKRSAAEKIQGVPWSERGEHCRSSHE